MDVYGILNKVTNGALVLIFLLLIVAAIDYYYFTEAYRTTISFVGKIALIVFGAGIVAALIKGFSDKIRQVK